MSIFSVNIRVLFIFFTFLFLNACAVRQEAFVPEIISVPTDEAAAVWELFEDYSMDMASLEEPFRLQCSMRYNNKEEHRRANIVIWGNERLPVRVDITVMGVLVGRIRQDDTGIIVHAVREGKALRHKGGYQALLNFGLPAPLSLLDIVAFLQGRYLEVFGLVEGYNPVQSEGGIRFNLSGGRLPGTVTISRQGLLSRWQEAPGGWEMKVSYSGSPLLPETIELSHPKGRNTVLSIISRERTEPFDDVQLELILPPDTIISTYDQALS